MDINKKIKQYFYKAGNKFLTKEEMKQSLLFEKYKNFTMVEKGYYANNLSISNKSHSVEGDVVECGVWRGGMIAGIAEIMGKKKRYHLFDSFEGLPEAKEIDGASAIDWQKNSTGEFYFDNCKAEIEFAEKAMQMSGASFTCYKGWFSDTLPQNKIEKISLLRLDGDWYDSTLVCLQHLFPKVSKKGIVIIDDYYTWDGCSRAVHDYLASVQSNSRISEFKGIAYIQKNDS
jgi:O-methyltransferase